MIEIIDTVALGVALKESRLSQNMTQRYLAKKIGINEKTYRDIELGKREPLLRTLFSIQRVLNTDLLSVLEASNYSSQYSSILSILDDLIFKGDMAKINQVIQNFSDLKEQYVLVEPRELIQFKFLLKALVERSHGTNASINKAINICVEAINTIERDQFFSFPKLNELNYSLLEYRILFFIGSCYSLLKDYEKSIPCSLFLIERLENKNLDTENSHKLIIKSYVNLSYDYNMMFKDHESIKYADLGIEACQKMKTNFLLYNLLFRKGASYFYLKDSVLMDKYIHQSLTLLDILGKEDLYKIYLDTAWEKFHYKL